MVSVVFRSSSPTQGYTERASKSRHDLASPVRRFRNLAALVAFLLGCSVVLYYASDPVPVATDIRSATSVLSPSPGMSSGP